MLCVLFYVSICQGIFARRGDVFIGIKGRLVTIWRNSGLIYSHYIKANQVEKKGLQL